MGFLIILALYFYSFLETDRNTQTLKPNNFKMIFVLLFYIGLTTLIWIACDKYPKYELDKQGGMSGIDANNNLIRDDVELLINKKFKDFEKIRLVSLLYAKEIQIILVNSGKAKNRDYEIKHFAAQDCFIKIRNEIDQYLKHKNIDPDIEVKNAVLNINLRYKEYAVVREHFDNLHLDTECPLML
jgi:hypothetical protein